MTKLEKARDRVVKAAPLSRHQVDMIIGMTPCVCGDIENWHPSHYKGKTDGQIESEYRRAYRKARKIIRNLAASEACAALAKLEKEKKRVR